MPTKNSNTDCAKLETYFINRFKNIDANIPLFNTDASGLLSTERIIDGNIITVNGKGIFLDNLPSDRQEYVCNTCSRFMENYANVVSIDEHGTVKSIFFDEKAVPAFFKEAIKKCRLKVESSKIKNVFLSDENILGTVSNKSKSGHVYKHFHTYNNRIFKKVGSTSNQEIAAKTQEFTMLLNSLTEFSEDVVDKALAFINSGNLYRSDKVKEIVTWFKNVHVRVNGANNKTKNLIIWNAVATAPIGFTYIRSSAAGTLLDDICNGYDSLTIMKRFAKIMDPLNYRRTTAEVSDGQIAIAEKAVSDLGVIPSFSRKYITEDDIMESGVVWYSSEVIKKKTSKKAVGVFDHLKNSEKPVDIDVPARLMTWDKFNRDILPNVAKLEYKVPVIGSFCGLTSAADPEAPPIIQWDSVDDRNSVSWAFPSRPVKASEWNLTSGELVEINKIVKSPNLWNSEHKKHGNGIFMLISGAKDTRNLNGGGFFVEHLNSELTPYRHVIEKHVNSLAVGGADESCGFGIGYFEGSKWTELAASNSNVSANKNTNIAPKVIHVILVIDDSGSMGSYINAAQKALNSLLTSIRQMPGKVDVTLIKFGNFATIIWNRKDINEIYDIGSIITGSSGGTALNDTIIDAINTTKKHNDFKDDETSFFLGIVTDGEENQSLNKIHHVRPLIDEAIRTGRWTIAYAGAGAHPSGYAASIGIPEGNIAIFEASAHGFDDIGNRYSKSAEGLARSYQSGSKSSNSFFAAANSREEVGTDNPVFLATMKDGSKSKFTIDRWE